MKRQQPVRAVTEGELEVALQKMWKSKAVGPDGVPVVTKVV